MCKFLMLLIIINVSTSHSQSKSGNHYTNNISFDSLKKGNSNFKSSYSINFSSGIFIPTKFYDEENIGTEFNIGLQKKISELTTLCLDIDMAYTNYTFSNYEYYLGKYITTSYWKAYLQFEFGSRYYFLNNGKFKMFAGPKIGSLLVKDRNNNWGFYSFIPLCLSLELGMQYRLNNNFSVLFKINHNSRLRMVFDVTELNNYIFMNGGISYQF